MLIKSVMERANRFMFETAEKPSLQKTRRLTVLAKTPNIRKGHIRIWIAKIRSSYISSLRI